MHFSIFHKEIEPSKDYTEREINDALLTWHTFADPATLRRKLYDYRFGTGAGMARHIVLRRSNQHHRNWDYPHKRRYIHGEASGNLL